MFVQYSNGDLDPAEHNGVVVGFNRSHKFSDFDICILRLYYKVMKSPPPRAKCRIIADQLNKYSNRLNLVREHSSETILNWFWRIHNINKDIQPFNVKQEIDEDGNPVGENLSQKYRKQIGSVARFSEEQIEHLNAAFPDSEDCYPTASAKNHKS